LYFFTTHTRNLADVVGVDDDVAGREIAVDDQKLGKIVHARRDVA
jgi:hypothetical protein